MAPFAAVQTARAAHSWPVALSGGMRKGRAARWDSGKVGSANRRTGVECCDHLIDLASPDSTSLRTLRAAKCSAGLVMELAILDEFLRWLTSLVIRPSTSAIFELMRINAPLVCRSIWVGSSYRRTAGVRLWGPQRQSAAQPLVLDQDGSFSGATAGGAGAGGIGSMFIVCWKIFRAPLIESHRHNG